MKEYTEKYRKLLSGMRNLRMREKIENGDATDISGSPRNADGDYVLNRFAEGLDYCDAESENWIWSIGRDLKTGEILASTSSKFYLNPKYECLFLR